MPSANLRDLVRAIFDRALADCSIPAAFDREMRIDTDGRLILERADIALAIDPARLKHVRIVAAGKAAAPMLQALLARLPLLPACDVQGALIAPVSPANLPSTIKFFPGGHPLPNQASFDGAFAALSVLRALPPTEPDATLCIFLISGGASAMMELPLDPTISLADTIGFHQALVHCGASIVEINCVRKHFSAVKGGRLALAAGAARQITLLVSDVPPAHLDALASGPTIADPTTVAQCREIVARYALLERLPASVRRFFESPALPETPKPGSIAARTVKLLDSDDLAAAAQPHAAALGFHAVIDNTCDDWHYDAAAEYLLGRLRQLRREHPRVCLISTGEVTVKLPPSAAAPAHCAIGGRNQHFALYLSTLLRPGDGPLAVLSAGSDGIDGNSPAAGAIVDEHTLNDQTLASAQRALADFDSSTWLSSNDATNVTGHTGQNLRDLRILLADAP